GIADDTADQTSRHTLKSLLYLAITARYFALRTYGTWVEPQEKAFRCRKAMAALPASRPTGTGPRGLARLAGVGARSAPTPERGRWVRETLSPRSVLARRRRQLRLDEIHDRG